MKYLHVTLRHANALIKDSDRVIVKFSYCNYPIFQSKCKRLYDLGNISNFYISSGTIRVETTETWNPISMTHTQGFTKHFLQVDLLPAS